MFSFFKKPTQSEKDYKLFVKKMELMGKIYPILQSNPFEGNYSVKEQSQANELFFETKEWWLNNREELLKYDWMNEKTYNDTNDAFGIEGMHI
ncbi:hypothetical protein OAU88_02030 [Flavobacteriaceae bacterium]|nr:hypothetical protein [Flavobacteriaceae bacterium]